MYVTADKRKLCQVFRNLLSNALKFTPPGGRVLIKAIGVTAIPVYNPLGFIGVRHSKLKLYPTEKQFLQIDFIDNGAGISKVNIFY